MRGNDEFCPVRERANATEGDEARLAGMHRFGMIGVVGAQPEKLAAKSRPRWKRWLLVSAGLLVAAFALALVLSAQNGRAPVEVRLAAWTNSTGGIRQPICELLNVSGKRVYSHAYCRIQAEGTVQRIIDFKKGSPTITLEPGESARVEVPLPAGITGEVRLSFLGVRPQTLMEDLAEIAGEVLAKFSIRSAKLDALADNGWSAETIFEAEEELLGNSVAGND